MKKQTRNLASDFLFPKQGAFSRIYSTAPSSDSKPLPKQSSGSISTSSRVQAAPPEPYKYPSNPSNSSPRKDPITWGVNGKDDTYQTTYSNCYATHDKFTSTPRTRDSFSPSQKISHTLIPYDHTETKRISKPGHHHPENMKRPTEGESLIDKIGERHQAASDRGRALVEGPKAKEATADGHRFYKALDSPNGVSSREISASRLVKQVLDLSPPKSLTSGTTVVRCLESLAFKHDTSESHGKAVDALGKGYMSVENKILRGERSQGKRVYARSSTEEEIKNLLSHSSVEGKEQKELSYTGRLSNRMENMYQPLSYRQHRPVQVTQASPRLALTPRGRESEERTYSSVHMRTSQGDSTQEKIILSNMSLLKSFSGTSYFNASKDRSRSNSEKSEKSVSRGASFGRFDEIDKDKSMDRNSFMVVSYERKKPISGGTFGNPKLFKGPAQKVGQKVAAKTTKKVQAQQPGQDGK